MIPVPSSSAKPLKPCLKRSQSCVRKAVTFSATNSQVFFVDEWDRSAVEVVSKLSYSDVLELKQLSLDSLPADRHASMGLSPLLTHVPLTLCPLASNEIKIGALPNSDSRLAPPSPSASSPLVVPDLSILASPASVNETLRGSPPPLSPPSSEAASSPPISLGTISSHSSASSPESTPPKPNVNLNAPVPVRRPRPLMANFMPVLGSGSESPSPVLSTASLSEDSSDSAETSSTFAPQTPITPRTPRTPHTAISLSPVPASPSSPTSFQIAHQQNQDLSTGRTSKSRAPKAEVTQLPALSGSVSGEFGTTGSLAPPKSADGKASPVSPISPASDSTVSVSSSAVFRPIPRRAYTAPTAKDAETSPVGNELVRRESFSSTKADDGPVARTKTSRSFDDTRTTRLAIASAAWADGVPAEKDSTPVEHIERPVSVQGFRQPSLSSQPVPVRPTGHSQRSHSFSDAYPTPSTKYVNPYAQIKEQDEPQDIPLVEGSRKYVRRPSLGDIPPLPLPRPSPSTNAKGNLALPSVPQNDDSFGLGLSRSSLQSMTRPSPIHRASVHGYPYGSGRPLSPAPQILPHPYPSPRSSNVSLPEPQIRPGKPLASKDGNIRHTTGSNYTLGPDVGPNVAFDARKPRSTEDTLFLGPKVAPLGAPMARPKNSKLGR